MTKTTSRNAARAEHEAEGDPETDKRTKAQQGPEELHKRGQGRLTRTRPAEGW